MDLRESNKVRMARNSAGELGTQLKAASSKILEEIRAEALHVEAKEIQR